MIDKRYGGGIIPLPSTIENIDAGYTGAMDTERLRTYLLNFPHTVETMQFGDNLVFWVGDKAIGGKMFALINLEGSGAGPSGDHERRVTKHGLMMYAVGRERYADLLEVEGLVPAPYMARIFWVAALRWDVFSTAEWQRELRAAYDLTMAKHSPKVKKILALPAAEQKRLIVEARKRAAEKAKR